MTTRDETGVSTRSTATTFADYLALPGINFSRLKALRISPRQFRYEQTHPRKDQVYFRVGRLMHSMVLQPHLVDTTYVCYEGSRRGKEWATFQDENQNRQILTRVEWDRSRAAADAVLRDANAHEVLDMIDACEVPLTWTDAETGAQCKGLADGLGSVLMDLKSSADPAPKWFPKTVEKLGYHIQLAMYFDGALASQCALDPEPRLIVVGSQPPHDVITWRVPSHVIDLGREEYRKLLRLMMHCIERGEWPGQAPYPLELELPDWAYPDAELPTLTFDGVGMEDL